MNNFNCCDLEQVYKPRFACTKCSVCGDKFTNPKFQHNNCIAPGGIFFQFDEIDHKITRPRRKMGPKARAWQKRHGN